MSALSIRGRLLISVIGAVAIALGGLVMAFNLVLAARLDAEASDLARARATAEVGTLDVSRGRIQLPEAPDAGTPDLQVWVFQGTRAIETPPVSAATDRAAAQLAARAPAFADVPRTETRLYASPVAESRRVGAVVVGVSLAPYEETRQTALIASLIFGVVVLALVAAVARWVIASALTPVARMTRQASQWSEQNLDRRFEHGRARDEIALLAETLNGLLERLASSLRHEQRLSAEISHELRTPLASIIAEAQLAQRQDRGDGAALRRILASARRLDGTLDALLSAARAEHQPHRTATDAIGCARAAIANAEPLAPALTVSAEQLGSPAWVALEQSLVERILAPLLENAVRHALSRVTITVEREEDAVRFVVQDDGPGIDEAEREAIFEPGHQVAVAPGSRAARTSGAGLGLALCRRLTRSAGGDVHADPAEDGGRFVVRLPAA